MDHFRDVQIFGIGGYVMSACIIDLIKSNLFKTILNNMNICDNCTEPIKIIMPDESSEVIKAAFNEVTWRPGLTIIQGMKKFAFYNVTSLIFPRQSV